VTRCSKIADSGQRIADSQHQIEKQKVNGKNCGIAALLKTEAGVNFVVIASR
jgi:hypothetical protein